MAKNVAKKLFDRENQHQMSPIPSYNHMEKTDFLYVEVEDPSDINLIMFIDSRVTFPAKIRKK